MLREIISNEWLTVLFVLCISLLATVKYLFANRFNDFLLVIGNSRYLKVYSREQKFIDLFDGLLFINLAISLAIFGLISYNVLSESVEFDIILFGKIVFAIGVVILIKILIERLIGSIFEIDQVIDDYLFQKTNYKNYIGLLLLPINILFVYAVEPSKLLIISAVIILALVNITGFFTTVKTYQKSVFNNLFYFILYLCALEIGPYIIIYKLLT